MHLLVGGWVNLPAKSVLRGVFSGCENVVNFVGGQFPRIVVVHHSCNLREINRVWGQFPSRVLSMGVKNGGWDGNVCFWWFVEKGVSWVGKFMGNGNIGGGVFLGHILGVKKWVRFWG